MWVERDYEDEKEVRQDDSDSNEPIADSKLEPEVAVRWQPVARECY